MMAGAWATIDRHDACVDVAYRLTDVIAIYPITKRLGLYRELAGKA